MNRRMLRREKRSRSQLPAVKESEAKKSAVLAGLTPVEVIGPLLWLLEAVGVSRREVIATMRALPPVRLPAPVTVAAGKLEYWSSLLIRWAVDPQFLGPDGRPLDLPFATGNPNFSVLVSTVLPRERPARCRDILLATGAILHLPNGCLRLRRRVALARGVDTGVVFADEYLRPLRALLLALQTNLLWHARKTRPVVFQRAVSGFEISPKDMSELQNFVGRHGTAFLETVDDWIANRQKKRPRTNNKKQKIIRPYLGLYLSSEPPDAQQAVILGNRMSSRTRGRRLPKRA